jgi:hypothetical protein
MHDHDSTPLNERLAKISPSIKPNLIKSLLADYPSIWDYYAQKGEDWQGIVGAQPNELIQRIASYLKMSTADMHHGFETDLGYSFRPKGGGQVNCAPLLDVIDGFPIGEGIDQRVFSALNDFEAFYFLPGLVLSKHSGFMGDRYTERKLLSWPVPEIVARAILLGIHKIGKYEKELADKKIPRKQEITDQCQYIISPPQGQLPLF